MSDTEPVSVDIVRLFDEESRQLYHYLARRVGPDAAEDALSQTFLQVHQAAARFDPARGPARAWLYGIASRVVHRHHRDEARRLRACARLPLEADIPPSDDLVADAVDAHAAYPVRVTSWCLTPRRARSSGNARSR